MAEQEEVLMEVEAVRAVYDDDCVVISIFPPHIHVHIKPRTADDSSQQFVEAVLGIQAGAEYPKEPPYVDIVESKGLDGKRQAHLITTIQEKAFELSSCLMLVALCEEAVEMISNMNHPDGDCPLCLYPLVSEDRHSDFFPFMKLMSCFHCFHSECIIRWWKWLQEQNKSSPINSSNATIPLSRDLEGLHDVHEMMKKNLGNCPVCRKDFHAKDMKHVLDLVGIYLSQLTLQRTEVNGNAELLQSDAENVRRQKFEAVLKLQHENGGLIEYKRNEVLLPGMFLPESTTLPTTSTKNPIEQQHRDSTFTASSGTASSGSSNKPSTSEDKSPGMRKTYRPRNPRKQIKRWIKKEKGTSE